jgi:hypothetical protein
MQNLIIQGIGIIGFITVVISFQSNKRKVILFFQFLASILFATHFFMLGSPTGGAMNVLGIFRGALFSQREDKKWADNKIFMFLFIALFITFGGLTWENIFSIFPIVAGVVQTVGLWVKNTTLIRIIMISSSPCWMVYNIHSGSIAGILTESFVMISILVAFVRFEVLDKNKV